MTPVPFFRALLVVGVFGGLFSGRLAADEPARLRVIIETDAGGDPDDEQSLVRFLLYANEWDVEGIVANRAEARAGENKNPERTGLGIVRRQLTAYGQSWRNLMRHDARYPTREALWACTVAGYDDSDDGVRLLIAAIDKDDPRPLWYADWGTDVGAAKNNLRRALDRVLNERGPAGYAAFKSRIRLASANAFGEHTDRIEPPFPLWVDTFRPELERKRWYHRFSELTATAGGFDIQRDVRTGHGPLGALYPLNTTHRQKEGDSMTFLYLVPAGMNDPLQPGWGSWAGRYGANPNFPGRPYYWANLADTWRNSTHRDNTLARWAVPMQNDFAARLDWCVAASFAEANHSPRAVLAGDTTKRVLKLSAKAGSDVTLSAAGSSDPDDNALQTTWFIYPEAGNYTGKLELRALAGESTGFVAPAVAQPQDVHVILQVQDAGVPQLYAYRRAVITIEP